MILLVPAYYGVSPRTVNSLLAAVVSCPAITEWMISPAGISQVAHARDKLAMAFLKSRHTESFWVDSDMVFKPQQVQDVIDEDGHIVCGTARFKIPPPAEAKWVTHTLAFTKIDRIVFEAMVDSGVAPKYGPEGHERYHFFPEFKEGEYAAEDTGFFVEAKKLGYEVTTTDIRIGHEGPYVYE